MAEIACNLSSCFLCSACIPEWKEAIAVKKKTLPFNKGQTIFKEGDEVKGIYFVYQGVVKVSMQWGREKELLLRFAKAGDVLGFRGLGNEPIYPISATALTETQLCYIPNDFLEATLRTNNSFTYQLLHVYAAELQRAEKRMRDLAHRDVKGRIAVALLELLELFGADSEQYIALPVSRQDIASFAGTTYETVFKFFVELTQAGVISTTGKNIRVNHIEGLQGFIKA
jgi:CRP/FNR family transcriptional regulator